MPKLSFSENKVARRIFISFVLAALIPTAILGYYSYQVVSKQLQEQTVTSLRKLSKDYAIALLDRLVMAENTLRLATYEIQKKGDGELIIGGSNDNGQLNNPFRHYSVVKSDDFNASGWTAEDMRLIASGKVLIKPVPADAAKSPTLLMAIKNPGYEGENGILIAELNPEFIWDSENQEPNDFWVVTGNGDELYASNQQLRLPDDVKNQFLLANSGQFNWKAGVDHYLGAYWQLPAQAVFPGFAVTIAQAQPEELAFSRLEQFEDIYPPVIVFSVLMAAYLSLRLIAANLKPLELLKTATQKISDGDLTYRLTIKSQDEFETLAGSFNEMTQRLSRQFDILSAMAEIDRHILSSLNAKDIVDTALTRLPAILFCDLISIAHLNAETYQVSDIRTRIVGQEANLVLDSVKLALQDVLDLLAMQNSVVETTAEGKFSAYTQCFQVVGDWRYVIVPIVVNGDLGAFICVGYLAPHRVNEEVLSAARNFGDRIAVALSNAAWEEKLYRQAHYDSLTGLPNRLVLNDRLNQEFARTRRDGSQLAVIFIDLDRFKNINDSLGHAAGDELLVKVSKLFLGCVRETDLVVRLGGDEFVIVITDLHHHINPTMKVSAIAEKILKALKQTQIIAGHPMSFTASLGIAVYPGDAENVQDLLKNADAAMYHAKAQGRDNFSFYSSELNASALENIKLEHDLRSAIGNGEMLILYQPKVDLNGRVVGAEALIRWQHPSYGVISPAKFIPIAEQSGLIVDIGEWVLEQTCLFVKECIQQYIDPVRISVNLSVVEFKRPELVSRIAWIISRTQVDPSLIELELTESIAISEVQSCVQRMNELKALGLKLSMDDFGTGFSSLSYLKDLPLDVLKIDQSFMRKLESENNSQAIVKAILALANGLGIETVAEGVETQSQLQFLKNHECHVFQGYLFSRPVAASDFLKMLADLPRKQVPI